MTKDYGRAREAIMRNLASRGWNPADLARHAQADQGTVLDFLNGKRTAQLRTRGKIEAALDWTPGTIDDIAAGGEIPPIKPPGEPPALSVVPDIVEPVPAAVIEQDNEVLTAIRRDPDLDDTAREHFLNQYVILRDFSRFRRDKGDLLPYVAHGERVGPADPEEERRLEELARKAARENPDSPYREK